ncbi:FAD-dependent oxidoreductase [Nocardia alni]|uniref:FAD-dependent oxidoreductase n=1 Tax=Nocardia alni TaxID=2815723 RepID=UPI001C22F8CC|nr:FAD-dependent monooxygenase [Nocardia alni]
MVTIVGGGISGTVLAGALAAGGHSAILYERQPAARGGQFLVLDDRAHRALAELGVSVNELHSVSHALTGLRVAHSADRVRDNPREGYRLYFRIDLMRVLSEFASATAAQLHYDTAITSVDPATGALRTGAVEIPCDGPIVGADGPDSIVRQCVDPDRRPEYAGQVVIYGTTSRPVRLDSAPHVLHFQGQRGDDAIPDSTFGHFWNDDVSVWFTRLTIPPLPIEDLGVRPVDLWAEQIRRAAPSIGELVETMVTATDSVHVINARNVPLAAARPPSERIVLCGDADHAITPAAGVGARDAIEDARAIVQAITSGASLSKAVSARRSEILAERDRVERAYQRVR